MRCYLSGPMRNLPLYNFPAFDAAEKLLTSQGWDVYNPARVDRAQDDFDPETGANSKTPEEYMRRDFGAILDPRTSAIAMLPGWRDSGGAPKEHAVAVAIGLSVLDATTGLPLSEESTLQEAERLINGPRQAAYSHPYDDFSTTGRMWGAILGVPDVSPENVGLCMVAVKLSRESRQHKRDNLTDMAGYAGCVEKIWERKAANGNP